MILGDRLPQSSGSRPAASLVESTRGEDYHERLEEEHLCRRLERAGRLTELVSVLRIQHRCGRGLPALERFTSPDPD